MIVRTAALYLLYALVSVNCNNTKFLDYYWKEYTGDIPNDAVPGGFNKKGIVTYIAQVYLSEYGLFPGTIVPGYIGAETNAAGDMRKSEQLENIKILCSSDHSKLNWVVTKSGDSSLFDHGCHVVNGGSEGSQVIHIGRVYYDLQITVGRVFSFYEEWIGLWIPYNGKQMKFDVYEVLTFDCDVYDEELEDLQLSGKQVNSAYVPRS